MPKNHFVSVVPIGASYTSRIPSNAAKTRRASPRLRQGVGAHVTRRRRSWRAGTGGGLSTR